MPRRNRPMIPPNVYWWPKHGHFWSAKGDRKSKEFEAFWLPLAASFPVFPGFGPRGEFQ